jgi:hypothetical protein
VGASQIAFPLLFRVLQSVCPVMDPPH